MRQSTLRGVIRAVAFALLTILLIVVFAILYPGGKPARAVVKKAWSRGTCWILGVRLRRTGHKVSEQPTLLVSNHVSYLDIPCIAAFVDGVFIAKSEVAGWPLFGVLAKITDTMFIRRHWREARRQRDAMAVRMQAGQLLILFGEGTSSNGLDVLPIKTTLLSVAEPGIVTRPIAVQSVTLAYRRFRDGTAIDPLNASLYAWWGDAELLPHLWRVLRLPGIDIEVNIGAPVPALAHINRKRLAPILRGEIRGALGPPAEVEEEVGIAPPIGPAAALS